MDLADGRSLWAVELMSPGALGVRLHFADLRLPPGGMLTVVSGAAPNDRIERWGPAARGGDVTAGRPEVWSPTIDGDLARVEYLAPAGAPRDLPFRLDRLQHHYAAPGGRSRKAGCTPEDALCAVDQAGEPLSDGLVVVGSIAGDASVARLGVLLANKTEGPLVLTSAMPAEEIAIAEIFAPASTCGDWRPPIRIGRRVTPLTIDTQRNLTALTITEGKSPDIPFFVRHDRGAKPRLPATAIGLARDFLSGPSSGDPSFPTGIVEKRAGRCPAGRTAVSASNLAMIGLGYAGEGVALNGDGMLTGMLDLDEPSGEPSDDCEEELCLNGMSYLIKNKTLAAAINKGLPVINPGARKNDCRSGGRRMSIGEVHEFILLGKQTLWSSFVAPPDVEVRVRLNKPTDASGIDVALFEDCPPPERPYFQQADIGAQTTFHYRQPGIGDRIVCLRLTRTDAGWEDPVRVEITATGS
jgi:hypothetical protein